MTTITTLHSGHDVAYFTNGQHAGGCAGAMSYYTASGEPPGRWAGTGAARLGLTGVVDPGVIQRLFMGEDRAGRGTAGPCTSNGCRSLPTPTGRWSPG